MHTERNEPRRDEETGKWHLWHVVESDVSGAGGGWPVMEITLGNAGVTIGEFLTQRESRLAELLEIDRQLAIWGQVRDALYAAAVSATSGGG